MKKVKVGIIGAGAIAQSQHMRCYAALKEAEIVAVADINPETAKTAAEKFAVPKVFRDYRRLLALQEIDAVSICTHNAVHKPAAVAALQAGKHVLVEKPMAMTAAEAKAMVETAKEAKRLLMTAFVCRFYAETQALKRDIGAGALGDIYYAEAVYTRRRGIPGWGVFTQKKFSGGGALLDIGVHALDMALHLMGFPRPIAVSALTFAKLGPRPHHAETAGYWNWDPKKFDVEDMAVGLVRFGNGACLRLKTSWAANLPQEEFRVLLAGTAGGGQTSPLEILREEYGALLTVTPQRLPTTDPYLEEVRAFVEAVRKGGPSPVPAEECLITNKIIDAIYRSARLGREVVV